jgi:hypothetical protein
MKSAGYFHFCASFRIIDAAQVHAEINSRLGLKPSSTTLRGDPLRELPDRTASHDMWVLDSPIPEESPFSEHLAWLDQQLRPHLEFLRSLRERGISMDIFLGYRTDHDCSQFQILPGRTDIASAIGVPLNVSIIVI